MLLHTASPETMEAKADADDLLTTRNTFDEEPSAGLTYSEDGISGELGASPPSFSQFMKVRFIVYSISTVRQTGRYKSFQPIAESHLHESHLLHTYWKCHCGSEDIIYL